MPAPSVTNLSKTSILKHRASIIAKRRVNASAAEKQSTVFAYRFPGRLLCQASSMMFGHEGNIGGAQRLANSSKELRYLMKHPPIVEVSVKSCDKARDNCIVEGIACESGTSNLLDVMHDTLSTVDLYSTWGKVWQCGGSGRCGQCRVKICRGHDLLSPKTSAERSHLKGMPWQRQCRLACQVQVGDGNNNGKIEVSLD